MLPEDKSRFFAALLEAMVNQMQWPADAEWDPADPGEEEDEEYEVFTQRRNVSTCMVAFFFLNQVTDHD